MLLLPQLMQIWLPEYSATHHENCSSHRSEQDPRSRIPPLLSFLEGLSDVLTPDGFPGKTFPCGHVVDLRSILAVCNLFGDAIWTESHYYSCARPDCEVTLELPVIPDPRVVDGLEARLDLIEWSWVKDKPTIPEMNMVSLLRDILSRIGHLSREPEPETDAGVSPREPSSSLMQTLVYMEIEAFGLMAVKRRDSAETAERGTYPYCSYRAIVPKAGFSAFRYPIMSPGQECECDIPHEYEREPHSWALTPAETDLDHDEPKDRKTKKRKTVRFVAPVVTEVQYFEPWWCNEYRDSDRYWSKGPNVRSTDLSTSIDDDWEIKILENPDGFEARMSKWFNGDEVLDAMDGANESRDEENAGETEHLGELEDEWF